MGSRLAHSHLVEDAKHPLILPAKCHFSTLIIRQYWIVKGRAEVKKSIRARTTCSRHAARLPNQLTGEFPKARVCPSLLFDHSGVDYAGPINVRLTKTREKGTMKGYIAIFICMATRAVHIGSRGLLE